MLYLIFSDSGTVVCEEFRDNIGAETFWDHRAMEHRRVVGGTGRSKWCRCAVSYYVVGSAIDCQQEMGNRLNWTVRLIQPTIPFPVVILRPNRVIHRQHKMKSRIGMNLSCSWIITHVANMSSHPTHPTAKVAKSQNSGQCCYLLSLSAAEMLWTSYMDGP